MPKLQIDGINIAEIDGDLAEKLRNIVAQHGVGRNQKLASFQQSVSTQPRKARQLEKVTINLEFG